MTRAERVLARQWRSVLFACALVALTGAVILIWARIDAADGRVDAEVSARQSAAAEANSRGKAVNTLAADVRALRAQVLAAGQSPVAPDPASAVPSLPERTVVPIPGPSGSPGSPGPEGSPGPSGSPGATGATGAAGKDGEPGAAGAQGPKGDTGPQGPAGPTGPAGKDGADGQTCPTGYSLQTPPADPDALECRRDGSSDSPTPGPSASQPAVVQDRRRS